MELPPHLVMEAQTDSGDGVLLPQVLEFKKAYITVCPSQEYTSSSSVLDPTWLHTTSLVADHGNQHQPNATQRQYNKHVYSICG